MFVGERGFEGVTTPAPPENFNHTHVDERLCGMNDMTFEEWERYQDPMLRYYSVYQYDNGPYVEEDEDDSSEEDESSDDDNHDRVCLCDPRRFQLSSKRMRQVARGSASDRLVLLKAISLT